MFDDYILDNTATQSDKYLRLKVDGISDQLWDLYGEVGQRIDFLGVNKSKI